MFFGLCLFLAWVYIPFGFILGFAICLFVGLCLCWSRLRLYSRRLRISLTAIVLLARDLYVRE